MKKILITICAIFIACIARADTMNLNWIVDDSVYDTTACTIGGDINLPATPTKRGYTFRGWVIYTPIEYIESTGIQWIDTGVYGSLDTSYEIVVKSNPGGVDNSLIIFGSRESASARNIETFMNFRGEFISDFGDYNSTRFVTASTYTLTTTNKIQIYNSKNFRSFNNLDTGITKSSSNTYTTSFTTPTTLKILGNLSPFGNFQGRTFYCKIWENNILVRDMIPVLDHNGVACMFDKVSRQFFYNAGTGDFVAGPVITE